MTMLLLTFASCNGAPNTELRTPMEGVLITPFQSSPRIFLENKAKLRRVRRQLGGLYSNDDSEGDSDYYNEPLFSSPEFQYIAPSVYPLAEEMLASPQLHRALEAYIRQNYGSLASQRVSMPQTNSGERTFEPMMPSTRRMESAPLIILKDPKNEHSGDDLEDYDYADQPSESEKNESTGSRRTFGILLNAILGGGGQSESTVDYERLRQAQLEADLRRETKETRLLDQLRTQQSLDALRQENTQNALQSKAELNQLKNNLIDLSDQRERERRENEELRIRLEQERSLREREKDDLKRKLDNESVERQRELMLLQQQFQQDAATRDIQTLEMQKRMELEKAKMDMELKTKMEMESKLELQRREVNSVQREMEVNMQMQQAQKELENKLQMQQAQKEMENKMQMQQMEYNMQNNVLKSSYQSMLNQKTINDYRSMESVPPIFSAPPAAPGPVMPEKPAPSIIFGPGQSMYIRP